MDSDSDSDVGEDSTKHRHRLFGRSGLLYWECVHKANDARLARILRSGENLKLLATQNDDTVEVFLLHCVCAERKFDVLKHLLSGRSVVNRHLGNPDPIEWPSDGEVMRSASIDIRVSSLAYIAHLTNSRHALEALKTEGVECPWITGSRTSTVGVELRFRIKQAFQRMIRRGTAESKLYERELHVQLFSAVEEGDIESLKRLNEVHGEEGPSGDDVLARYLTSADPRRDTTKHTADVETSTSVQFGWCVFCPNLLEAALLRSRVDLAEELWVKFGDIIKPSLEDHLHNYWLFVLTLLSDGNTAFQWLLHHYPLDCLKFFSKRMIPTQQPKSLLALAAELGNSDILCDLLELISERCSDADKKAAVVQAVFASILSCQGRSIELLMPTFLSLSDDGLRAALLEMAINLQSRLVLAILLCFLEEKDIAIDNGQTLLHAAAVYDWPDGARMLLHAGLDPNIKDAHGRKPIDCARLHSPDAQKVFEGFTGLSLFEVCLVVVRKSLQPYVAGNTDKLPLPDSMKRAVLYQRRLV